MARLAALIGIAGALLVVSCGNVMLGSGYVSRISERRMRRA
jgi:hypothetical protein